MFWYLMQCHLYMFKRVQIVFGGAAYLCDIRGRIKKAWPWTAPLTTVINPFHSSSGSISTHPGWGYRRDTCNEEAAVRFHTLEGTGTILSSHSFLSTGCHLPSRSRTPWCWHSYRTHGTLWKLFPHQQREWNSLVCRTRFSESPLHNALIQKAAKIFESPWLWAGQRGSELLVKWYSFQFCSLDICVSFLQRLECRVDFYPVKKADWMFFTSLLWSCGQQWTNNNRKHVCVPPNFPKLWSRALF